MSNTYSPYYAQTGNLFSILRSDGSAIPIDINNSDYQKFLKDNGGVNPFPLTGTPTNPILTPKDIPSIVTQIKALTSSNQTALLNDLLSKLLLQYPDIATKYGITVYQ